MVEEEMEGDVVMVRLGADEGRVEADEAEEHGSSYMGLKPSATLLVPLELMERQDTMVDGSQLCISELHPTIVPDEVCVSLSSETHSSFSLMLDMDGEAYKDAELPPTKDDLQFSDPPAVQTGDEPMAKPEVILSDIDDQDALLTVEPFEEEERKDCNMLDGVNVDGLTESAHVTLVDQTDLQMQNTEVILESEDDKEQVDAELVMLAEDQEPARLLASGLSPVEHLAVVTEQNAVEEDQEEPEENGPFNIDTDIAHITEMETILDDKQLDHKATETGEGDNEETETNTETKSSGNETSRQHKEAEEDEPVSNSQTGEQPSLETPSSQRKRTAPSTPTRRTTRGRMVSFISPLPEEAEEPQEDGKVVEVETSTVVPASPGRTPRKGKQEVKVRASTPRRSARKAQQEAPKDEVDELVEATDQDATLPSTSKATSPARRRVSQRATSTRSSQSSSRDVSPPTEVEVKVEQEDEVTDTKASQQTSSKTPTPAKRRTAQGHTPRRSSRRTPSSSEVLPSQLEILKEEKEQEEVLASTVRSNPRKTKTGPSEIQRVALEEEEEDKNNQVSSPGRTTRQSSRPALKMYPHVRSHKCVCDC